MTDRPRLGKGLSALIGEYLDPETDSTEVRALPLAAIVPNPLQPRRVFTEQELSDLTQSIEANGLLQPLVVRPSPSASNDASTKPSLVRLLRMMSTPFPPVAAWI